MAGSYAVAAPPVATYGNGPVMASYPVGGYYPSSVPVAYPAGGYYASGQVISGYTGYSVPVATTPVVTYPVTYVVP